MLANIIISSILIILVLIIRAVFQKKISPVLLYSIWLVVAVRLLLPGTVGLSPFSIMNTKLWNMGSQVLSRENDRQERESKERQFQEYLEKRQEEYRLLAESAASSREQEAREPSAAASNEGPEALEPSAAAGSRELEARENAAAGKEAKNQEIPLSENHGIETYELKWQLSRTLFGRIRQISAIIWFMGMAVFALIFLWSNISFYKYLRTTRKKITEITAGRRSIPVFETGSRLNSPCLFGLFPAVYIPKDIYENMQKEQLAFILEHELTHYRHGDHIFALVRIVCLIVHWYNPLVWIAAKLSVRDGEFSCDAGCIKRIGEEKRCAYGEALIAIIKPVKKKEELLKYATMMTSGKKFMKRRMEIIVEDRKNSIFFRVLAIVLTLFCVVFTYTGPSLGENAAKIILENHNSALFTEQFKAYAER